MDFSTILAPAPIFPLSRSSKNLRIDLHVRGNVVVATKTADNTRGFSGRYLKLGDVLLGIFCFQRELLVVVDDRIHTTSDLDFHISHQHEGNHKVLHIESEGRVYDINYETEEPVSTMFYSEHEEDVDFGLWLLNVLNSNERRDLCIDHWTHEA